MQRAEGGKATLRTTWAEPELPATNAARTMAAFVSSPAAALMRKAIDSRSVSICAAFCGNVRGVFLSRQMTARVWYEAFKREPS